MDEEAAIRGTLGTVRNATALLGLLAEGPAYQQLTELAERSEMSLPTVHRLLRSLVLAGLADQDPKSLRYGLGPEVVRLAQRYLGRLPVLRALAPYLIELRNSTKATIQVAILVRGSVLYVDRVDGEDGGGVFRQTHGMYHALETAAGRVLLGHANDETWEEALGGAASNGPRPNSKTRRKWMEARYLTHGLEYSDALEVAVPVADVRGQVGAALSAMAGPQVFTDDQMVDSVAGHLIRVARAVERTVTDV